MVEEVIGLGSSKGGSLFRRDGEAGQTKGDHKVHYSYIGLDLMMECPARMSARLAERWAWLERRVSDRKYISHWHSRNWCQSD